MRFPALALFLCLLALGLHAQTPEQLLLDGIADYENGNYASGIGKLSKSSETLKTKDVPTALYYLGLCHYRMATDPEAATNGADVKGLLAKANAYFVKGTEKNPRYGYNFAGLGLIQIQSLQVDEAKANFKKAVEMAPDDVELLIALADAYVALYNKQDAPKPVRTEALDQATQLLTRADQAAPNNAKVSIGLGEVYEAQRVYELAKRNYERAVEKSPGSAKAHFNLGRLYIKLEKYQEGQQALIKAKEADPNFSPTYLELAELYFIAQKYDAALAQLREYRDLIATAGGNKKYADVKYALSLYLSANRLKAMGTAKTAEKAKEQYAAAAAEFEAVMKDTSSLVFHRLYGFSLAETDRFAEAKTQLDKFFAGAKPENFIPKDYRYMGLVLQNLKQFDAAVGMYAKAIEAEQKEAQPNLAGLNRSMFECYKAQEKWPEAVAALEKEYAISKSSNDLYLLGFYCYNRLRNYQNAFIYLDSLIRIKPDIDIIDVWYYHFLASSQIENLDSLRTGFAQPSAEKSMSLLEENVSNGEITLEKANKYLRNVYEYLIKRYYKISRDADCKAVLEKLKAIDPQHPTVKELGPTILKN